MARPRGFPGYLDRPGKSWRVRISVDGERYSKVLPGASKAEAEIHARDKYQEMKRRAKRKRLGLPVDVAVSQLLDDYEEETLPTLAPNTQTSYKVSLRPIRAFFVEELRDPAVEDVLAGHVQRYLDWRRLRDPDGNKRSEPLSNRTLEKERAILHRIFTIADKLELRDGNPVTKTEAPKVKGRDPVILSDAEYEKLLAKCTHNPMLYLYALLLGETGVRCESEALWLRWEDVKLDEGFLWVDSAYHGRRTKSGKGRWVPMTARLRDAVRDHFARFRLQRYKAGRSPWVFHLRCRNRGARAGDRIRCFRRPLMRAAEKAKLPAGFRQHDLRHRRVTTWLAAGKSPVLVQEAMGHADIATTMRYTHLARQHLRALVEEPEDDKARLEELKG